MRKLTTKEFIRKSKEIHGNKYDYLNICYVNNINHVSIICEKHGKFFQRPIDHLRGCGCFKCGLRKSHLKTTLSTNEFIEKAKKVHGNRYDYSKVNYKNCNCKIKIACKKHGEFLQTPASHLRKRGCLTCGYKKVSQKLKNRLRSREHKRNIRLSHIKKIKKLKCNGHQLFPFFNKKACQFIDEYGKKNGYNFQHAMNGGEFYIKELGYWVDGYDKEKNVVFEYDEPHHSYKKEKDIQRMNEIKEYLKCIFLRYTEKTKELKQYS